MPNRPNEGGLFPGPKRVPHLRPKEPIVAWKVALPFVRRAGGSRVPIDDKVSTVFRSVIKKPATTNPTPSVRIPPKGGHFPIEENNFVPFSLLLRASIGMNSFNFVKKTFHLPEWVLPFPKVMPTHDGGGQQ